MGSLNKRYWKSKSAKNRKRRFITVDFADASNLEKGVGTGTLVARFLPKKTFRSFGFSKQEVLELQIGQKSEKYLHNSRFRGRFELKKRRWYWDVGGPHFLGLNRVKVGRSEGGGGQIKNRRTFCETEMSEKNGKMPKNGKN